MGRRMPLFYGAIALTAVNLLLRLVGTSFQVYISGRIGPAGVGLLQLVLSVGSLAMVAGIAGVRTAAMYLTAGQLGRKQPQNVTWVLSACFLYSLICSGTVAGLLYGFAPRIATAWIGDRRTVGALRLLAAFLPVSCLCGVMTGYFTAANRIATLAAVEVAEQLCSMAITLTALIGWAGDDPGRACVSVVIGSCAGAVLTLSLLIGLRIREKAPAGPRLSVRKELLRTAVPLALADDLKSGISTVENLMVPRRLEMYAQIAEPLAAFGIVSGMVFPILMFPACILYALAELLIPELARCAAAGSRTRIRYLVRRSLRLAMVYGLLCGGLQWLFAHVLCIQLYGNAEAGRFLRLYAPLIPMLYCDAITDAMNKGLGQQHICVRFNILTAAMDVAFLYFLLPKYGMMGYFFSFFVTHLINFALSLGLLLKITGFRLPPHLPMLAASAALAAAWGAARLRAPWAQVGSYCALLGTLLYLLRIVRKEDIRWVKGLIRRPRP